MKAPYRKMQHHWFTQPETILAAIESTFASFKWLPIERDYPYHLVEVKHAVGVFTRSFFIDMREAEPAAKLNTSINELIKRLQRQRKITTALYEPADTTSVATALS